MKYLLFLCCCLAAIAAERPPAVMLLADGHADWGLPRRITAETGTVFGAVTFGELTWERLQPFNAVIVFDLSRLDPNAPSTNHVNLTPEAHDRIADLLERYVREGGGLYLYGCSFTHMGQGLAVDSLNRFLQRLDARVLFEELRDPPMELRQTEGARVLYARPDEIVDHPATRGVSAWWYPLGPFSYGPWARPLRLGQGWSPLIFTSPAFTSTPLGNAREHAQPVAGARTGVEGTRAVIYAVREFGKGRIVLNGSESTISFFNYNYSPYADRHWGRLGNDLGPDGGRSCGVELFASSLAWLVEPSLQSGAFGGYTPPPPVPFEPRVEPPIAWPAPGTVSGKLPWQKGVIGAMPAGAGGSGTVAEYAAKATALGLGYLVLAGDFEQMDEAAWQRLCADCAAATGETFAAIPALVTRDHLGDRFLQAGEQSWPHASRLDPAEPRRVRDHLGYWMNDANFPMRAAFDFSHGHYPAWLHSGYDTFAVRTWRDGELIDDSLEGLLDAQAQGDKPRVVSIHLLSSPEKLEAVTEFTWLYGATPAAVAKSLRVGQFNGATAGCVSSGPVIGQWHVANARRNTFGVPYVPGTERWRATLAVDSAAPLTQATVYDGTRVFRRYALSGHRAELTVDGLHDGRHVLSVVVEDAAGGRAVTGAFDIQENAFVQTFCSDRCNIMAGQQVSRHPDGRLETLPATAQLYKAGRLQACTVGRGESLPGIDGSGGGVLFFLNADLRLTATDPAHDEQRSQVHRIYRPSESALAIVFDTPIERRSDSPEHLIFGHAPYVPLAEPRVDARLVQYHFYRQPPYPSLAIADFTLTAKGDLQTKPGWQGLTARYANNWTKITRYEVIRADNSSVTGPAADESAGTAWRGELQAGDSIYFPDLGEGFYVGRGPLGVVIECVPSKQWFRLWLGRADAFALKAGESVSARLLPARMAEAQDAGRAQWLAFRDAFGLTGRPAYSVEVTGGEVVEAGYPLALRAAGPGLTVAFARTSLPQQLPIQIAGLDPRCTAALVDLDREEWFPLAVWNDTALTLIGLTERPRRVYLGNLLACDSPELRLTFLPANADSSTQVDAHNPTDAPIAATVRVPVATWLAPVQQHAVTVPPRSSIRLTLDPQPKASAP